jgi:hypothetical protein
MSDGRPKISSIDDFKSPGPGRPGIQYLVDLKTDPDNDLFSKFVARTVHNRRDLGQRAAPKTLICCSWPYCRFDDIKSPG